MKINEIYRVFNLNKLLICFFFVAIAPLCYLVEGGGVEPPLMVEDCIPVLLLRFAGFYLP